MIKVKWELVLVMALAVALALAIFGLRIANPHDISWMHHDTVTGQFGWEMYRHDPDNYYPIATNRYSYPLMMPMAMFDNIPALALLLKLLVPVSPAPFQYVGPLFLIGIALQALFGWLALARSDARQVGRGLPGFPGHRHAVHRDHAYCAVPLPYHPHGADPAVAAARRAVALPAQRAGGGHRAHCVTYLAGVPRRHVQRLYHGDDADVLLRLPAEAGDRPRARLEACGWAPLPFMAGVLAMLTWGFIDFSGGKLLSGEGYQLFSANLFTLFDPEV